MTKGKTQRTLVAALALLSVAAVALQGCQSQQATPTAPSKPAATAAPAAAPTVAGPAAAPTQAAAAPTQAAAPTAAPEVYKVGIGVSLTGPTARMGMNVERYIRFGIEDLNAKGGFKVGNKTFTLEAVTVDEKSTSEGGREAANRLVLAEKVNVIMGQVSTALAGAQAVTEPNGVLSLAFTALDKSLGPKFPLTFQMGFPHPLMRIGVLYDLLKQEHPNAKRVAFLYSDDPTGHSIAAQALEVAKGRGFEVIAQEFYPLDIKDFSPIVTRMLSLKPDAIDVGGAGGRETQFTMMMKALKEQGFTGPIFGVSAGTTAMKEGVAFMEGFTVTALADRKAPAVLDADKRLMERYIAKYGEAELEPVPIPNYNSPIALAQMATKAGTLDDATKLAQAFRSMEFDTIYGKQKLGGEKTFGLPVMPSFPVYFSGIRNGQLTTFKYLNATLP